MSTLADPLGFLSEDAKRTYGRQLSHFGEYFVLFLLLYWAVVTYWRTRAAYGSVEIGYQPTNGGLRPSSAAPKPSGTASDPPGTVHRPSGVRTGRAGKVYRPSGAMPKTRSAARPAGLWRSTPARSDDSLMAALDPNIRAAAVLALVVALIDEAYQGLLAGRQFGLGDLLFDGLGITAAIALLVMVKSWLPVKSAF